VGVKNCRIPPPIGTPLIKGGRGDQTPLIKGRSPRLSAPPLSRGAGGIKPPLSCPSSTMTLKMGIERRLREVIPEIAEVEQAF